MPSRYRLAWRYAHWRRWRLGWWRRGTGYGRTPFKYWAIGPLELRKRLEGEEW